MKFVKMNVEITAPFSVGKHASLETIFGGNFKGIDLEKFFVLILVRETKKNVIWTT